MLLMCCLPLPLLHLLFCCLVERGTLADIQAGQGLYVQTTSSTWLSRNCDRDNFGASNTTFGLTPSPCRPCPGNMVARRDTQAYPNSVRHFVRGTNGSAGFVSERACVVQPGVLGPAG